MVRKQSRILNTVPPRKPEDFRLIKGIGPVLARRLYKAGICTYKQLASLSPAKLAEMVTGLSAKQISKQDWSSQARKLATKKTQPKPSQKDGAKRSISLHYENFTIEFLVNEKHAVRRTRVAHIQSGDADTWAGWEARQLIDFLARHTGVRVPVARPEKQSSYSADRNMDFHDGNNEPQTAELEIEASKTPSLASPAAPVEETTLPALELPVAPPLGGTLYLRKIEVLTPDSDRSVTFVGQEQSYLVRLTLDLTQVNVPSDLALICKASVVSRRLGGTRHSMGETLSTLNFSKSVNLDINGIGLSPGIYRLEAFAEIRYDEATPGPTASLKGGLLQVY